MARILLLLPSATYRATDFLAAAKRLGVEVVVASDQPQTLVEVELVDFSDQERIAEQAMAIHRQNPLDAVVAVDDQGIVAAEAASRAIGLRHNRPGAAGATRNKAFMRAALEAGGVPQPRWSEVAAGEPVDRAVGAIGLPCVIKPLSLSASRGVIRADDLESARMASRRTRDIVACETGEESASLLVEAYVPGVEVAVEALASAGHIEILAIFDKPDPLEGPFFEETIYVTPSVLAPDARAEVAEVLSRAAAALGITEGPIHGELRVDGSEARCIEVAARSIGGHCSRTLRFGTGISLEELILRQALGMGSGGLALEPGAAGVMMLPIPAAGILDRVDGQHEALATPGIVALEITIAPGRKLVPLPEGDRYLGFMYARGDDPAGVEAALRNAHGALSVRLRAEAPGSSVS